MQQETSSLKANIEGMNTRIWNPDKVAVPPVRIPRLEKSCDPEFLEIAKRIRESEQNLKENLDFYIPLEDILGVPVIGMDVYEFLESIWGHEGVGVNIEKATIKARRLILGIYPAHIRRKTAGACLGMYGVGVSIGILPDNTLRPLLICDYNRLSPAYDIDSESDNLKYSQVELIGRNLNPDKPAAYLPYMRITEYEYEDIALYYKNIPPKGYRIRAYDTTGICIFKEAENYCGNSRNPHSP